MNSMLPNLRTITLTAVLSVPWGTAGLLAQGATPKTVTGEAVTGTMQIEFATRLRGHVDASGQPNKGVKDTYSIDLKVGAVGIKGKVERTPRIASKLLGREV